MRTSPNGLRLIEQFEGYSSKRYLDSVGVPTIGFGTTAADIGTVPPSCTREQAEGWLRGNLERKYEPAVNRLGVPLTQNQFDALVSLAYNCGPGSMQWQIGRDLRARNYKAASADFMRYVYAGGHVLQGLVNRRAAERRLFDTPDSGKAPAPAPAPPKTEEDILALTSFVSSDGNAHVVVEDKNGNLWYTWQRKGESAWNGGKAGVSVAGLTLFAHAPKT